MAGNETTTPTPTQAADTPEALAQLPTQITVSGRQFELRNMSEAQGRELYNALSPTDQQRATALASFIQNFRAPLVDELPEALREPGRLEEFLTHMQANAGRVTDSAPSWMRDLYGSAMSGAGQLPGADWVRSIAGVYNGASSLAGGAGNTLQSAYDISMLTPRAIQYAISRGREWWGEQSTPPTPEQALSMASAYQGALVSTRQESGFASQAGSWVEWGFGYIKQVALTAWNFVSNGFSGRGWDLGAAWEQSRESSGIGRSREEILQENLERPQQARAILRNSETIAGRPTAPIADIMETGGTFQRHDGTIGSVDEQGNERNLNGPNGQPLTMDQVHEAQQEGILGSLRSQHPAVLVGGAAVAGWAGVRFGPPAFNIVRNTVLHTTTSAINLGAGVVSGAARWTAEHVDLRSGTAARNATNNLDRLNGQRVNVTEELVDARARLDTADGRVSRFRAQRQVTGLEAQLERLDNQIDNGTTNWRGRQRPSATQVAESATDLHAERLENAGRVGRARNGLANALHATADGAEHIGGGATRVIARAASSEARALGWGARALRWGGRLGRAIPFVGLIGTGAALLMAADDAHAADYSEGANYRNRLDEDLARGRITQTQYNTYSGLQATYFATGLGGILTAGVTELVQNGAQHMDRDGMSRYLPPSLVNDISGLVESAQGNGAAGQSDQGVTTAVVDQTERARRQAAPVFTNVRDVHNGGNATMADVQTAPSRPAPMREQVFVS